MKQYCITLLIVALTAGLKAQFHSCGHEELVRLQKENNPKYEQQVRQNNLHIREFIQDRSSQQYNRATAATAQPSVYLIPVVFHVVHPAGQSYGAGANITYKQILSQIDALNAAFAKNYPAYNGQSHAPYAQNTTIQFCLAKTSMPANASFYSGPQGIEYGVMRYSDNINTNHQMGNAGMSSLLSLTHPNGTYFPFGSYLNIWVVTSIGASFAGTTMGYAPSPLMTNVPLDGVIIRSDVVGDNTTGNSFNLGYGLQQGKVLTHEIGHYLNLYHIFEGGCSGMNAAGSGTDPCDMNGDFICDTDPCTTQNISCNVPIPNTCVANYNTGTTALDMLSNYMSYADDDCMNTFTADQCQRMWATLGLMRYNLWQPANHAATGIMGPNGCIPSMLIATINQSSNNFCQGIPVQFSNIVSGNSAISRSWTFQGATPAASSSPSVSVTFTSTGGFWARLAVSNGTLTAKDSVFVQVSNCTLDSTKLDRANWFFGTYCEINFNTNPVSVGNSAMTYSTIQNGMEATVSMSDKHGNLLFYTNCINLWNGKHQQVNSTSPIFDVGNGSSTPGVISIPFPKDSSRYIIISSPHTGNPVDSIYYVVYDTVAQTLTNRRGFIHPLLPSKYEEPLTVVPHCNGIDYWVICRPRFASANDDRIYSILITPAGPGNIDTVAVSYGMSPVGTGQFKANSKGTRLIEATYNNVGPAAFFYDFDKATGLLSNEVPLALGSPAVGGYGAIFSPHDSVAYAITQDFSQTRLWKINPQTYATQQMTSYFSGAAMETGPDNNIYVSEYNVTATGMGRIVNADNWNNTTYVPNVLWFYPGAILFDAICNFMDAKKGPEIPVNFTMQSSACGTYSFSADNCWQMYRASWNFGDGSVAQGLSAGHTYSAAGTYSVKLQLAVGQYSLAPVIKIINVLSGTIAISGPPVICKGDPYATTYYLGPLSQASYSWSALNATLTSLNNQSSASLAGNSLGVATLFVSVNASSCLASGTKTILIDQGPAISFSNAASCTKQLVTLSALPPNGIFTGSLVSNNSFLTATAGNYTVYYTATNANNCPSTAAAVLSISDCTGLQEEAPMAGSIYITPNPGTGEYRVQCPKLFKNCRIEIYSSIGGLILVETPGDENNFNISMHANGIYYVRIRNDEGIIYTGKILKE